MDCAARLTKSSEDFVQSYGARKATNANYPELVLEQLDCLAAVAQQLDDKQLVKGMNDIRQHLTTDLTKLQKAHQDYLTRLDALARS